MDRTKLETYAWPGGYPIYYYTHENRDVQNRTVLLVACAKCAKDVTSWPDMEMFSGQVNWEDTDLQCEYCDELIESAYGEK